MNRRDLYIKPTSGSGSLPQNIYFNSNQLITNQDINGPLYFNIVDIENNPISCNLINIDPIARIFDIEVDGLIAPIPIINELTFTNNQGFVHDELIPENIINSNQVINYNININDPLSAYSNFMFSTVSPGHYEITLF